MALVAAQIAVPPSTPPSHSPSIVAPFVSDFVPLEIADDADIPPHVEIVAPKVSRKVSQPLLRNRIRKGSAPKSLLWEGDVWIVLADCETGDHKIGPPYSMNLTDAGSHHGALQFSPATWIRAGGLRYAKYAFLATWAQQRQIAIEWLARTSWAQWPLCARMMGLR